MYCKIPLLLLLCSSSALLAPAQSAGITVHTEVGRRALDLYQSDVFGAGEARRILEEHQDAFQAGIPFPDFFYNALCGDHGGVAEDSHWGPYLAVAVEYFRDAYPAPFIGDEDAEKLFAFLFGIATHQVGGGRKGGGRGLDDGQDTRSAFPILCNPTILRY